MLAVELLVSLESSAVKMSKEYVQVSVKPVIMQLHNYCQEQPLFGGRRALMSKAGCGWVRIRLRQQDVQNSGRYRAAHLLERRFCHGSALAAAPPLRRVDHVYTDAATSI